MKNKEIEELLNYIDQFVYVDQTYNDIKLSKIDCKLLLSYIEQLEKENKILKENAEHNDKVVDKVNWEINILKHNRDKAIEYLEEKADYPISYYHCIREAIDILKGDSE